MLSTWKNQTRFLFAFAAFCAAVLLVFLTARTNGFSPQQANEPKNILTIKTPEKKTVNQPQFVTPAAANEPAGPSGVKKNDDGTFGNDHVDPVKLNGQIFEGWVDATTKAGPRAVLIITGGQDGYIEPCGCSGLENQKGGMSRRHTMLKDLDKRGWKYASIDAGGLVKGVGEQAKYKYEMAINALRAMNYEVIGLGAPELRLSADQIISTIYGGKTGAIVSSNIGLMGAFDDEYQKRFHVVNINGYKVGVASVVGESEYKKLQNKDLLTESPVQSLGKIVPELKKQNCQTLVLLTYGSRAEAKKLAEAFPEFQYVVTTESDDNALLEPTAHTFKIGETEYKTKILESSKKGMYALALGFYDNPEKTIKYQRIPLDARFADSPEITELFIKYQDTLQQVGLKGLQVNEGPHPSGNGKFAGTDSCAACHKKAYAVWKGSPHAHATDTIEKLKPQRHFDPECLACHVTGWDPIGFRPYEKGYKGLKETPEMKQNGCENCHGPGKKHVDIETELALGKKTDATTVAQLRTNLKVAKNQSTCVKCHDVDNSRDFDFDTYWPQVEHTGKD